MTVRIGVSRELDPLITDCFSCLLRVGSNSIPYLGEILFFRSLISLPTIIHELGLES